jgi:hypothetical protein
MGALGQEQADRKLTFRKRPRRDELTTVQLPDDSIGIPFRLCINEEAVVAQIRNPVFGYPEDGIQT